MVFSCAQEKNEVPVFTFKNSLMESSIFSCVKCIVKTFKQAGIRCVVIDYHPQLQCVHPLVKVKFQDFCRTFKALFQ